MTGASSTVIAPSDANALQRFEGWFYGLHYVRFGGVGVRLLYALLAFSTCAVIVTGNVLWLERRDPTRSSRGGRLLERLTVGVAAGAPLATAASFVVNRALPADVGGRSRVEQLTFLVAFVIAVVVPLAHASPRRALRRELAAAGVLFALAPLLAVAQAPHSLRNPLHQGVAIALVALGSLCAWEAFALRDRGVSSQEPERAIGCAAPSLDDGA